MKFSRRRFVLVGLLAGLWASFGRLFGKGSDVSADEIDILEVWVEALLPSDELSPGAGRLNVHVELFEEAAKAPRTRGLLTLGVAWLSRHGFGELSESDRDRIIRQASEMDRNEMPRAFFEYTFRMSKKLYYSKPESWAGLGIERPPQPFGYMNYQEPVE